MDSDVERFRKNVSDRVMIESAETILNKDYEKLFTIVTEQLGSAFVDIGFKVAPVFTLVVDGPIATVTAADSWTRQAMTDLMGTTPSESEPVSIRIDLSIKGVVQ